jgi:hypothetical protein
MPRSSWKRSSNTEPEKVPFHTPAFVQVLALLALRAFVGGGRHRIMPAGAAVAALLLPKTHINSIERTILMSTNLSNIVGAASGLFGGAAPAAPARGAQNQRQDRPEAKVWLNLGIDVEIPLENGETKTVFIPLPKGIAIDTMEPAEEKGSDEWVELMRARNLVLNALKTEGLAVEPGKTKRINLVAEMRHVAGPVAVKPVGESPLLSALVGKLST